MNVGELIEELRKFDPKTEIIQCERFFETETDICACVGAGVHCQKLDQDLVMFLLRIREKK